jgi:hypothetical protein
MIPPTDPYPKIVEWRPDTSRTASGGWVRDSNGTWWEIVDSLGPRGTADRHAQIIDGRIYEK